MSTEYDVLIVGGGIAGLTNAAYLCKQGYRVLLCEKSETTGGLVKTFWHQGFAFDAGIRAFENSGILFPMLKRLDLDIRFVQNPVSIGIDRQWTLLHSRDSLHPYFEMLSRMFPQNRSDINSIEAQVANIIKYMDVLYGIDNPLFLEKPDKDYLIKTLLPWLIKYQINIRKASCLNMPVRAYLHRYTQNEALIDMLIQHFFSETPTFFALSYFGQYFDYNYPLGGTGVLVEKLTQSIKANGGSIMAGTAVTALDSQNHQASTQQGDVFRYKKLVWAADQKLLYAALKPTKTVAIERQRTLVKGSSGCDSVLAVFIGLNLSSDIVATLIGPHAFYTPSTDGLSSLADWHMSADKGSDALLGWVSTYLERTTYEISCPSLRDPTLAPPGKTSMAISTLMDVGIVRLFSDAGTYDNFKQFCSEKIVEVLEKVIPGLANKTAFCICATPMTIEHETGNTDGAITGWAFTNRPIPAENSFRKIARAVQTPITDVYQCGQWTFSPSGLPISILTAKLAADAINKDLRKR